MRLPQFYPHVPPCAMEALDTPDEALRELTARLVVVADNDRWRRRVDALWRNLSRRELPEGWGFELILAAYIGQGKALLATATAGAAQLAGLRDMTALLQHAQALRRLLTRHPMAVPIGGGAIKNERRSPLPVNARHVIDYVSAEAGQRRSRLLAELAAAGDDGGGLVAVRRDMIIRTLNWAFFAPADASDLFRCIATVTEAVLDSRVGERDVAAALAPTA